MQDDIFKNLMDRMSSERLLSYKTDTCKNALDITSRYYWNLALCEAFYPSLHTLEIGLRNATDRALASKHTGQWLQGSILPFNAYQIDTIDAAEKALTKCGKTCDRGRMIAELPFGFWSSLYGTHMEQSWHGILKTAFPGLKGKSRTRATIAQRLDVLRSFRNRVFHHEIIIKRQFMAIHAEILETIGWISSDLLGLVNTLDRVTDVYNAGPKAVSGRIRSYCCNDKSVQVADY